MNIVAADSSHAASVCDLIQRMHAESKYAYLKYDPNKVQRLVNAAIHNQDSVVLVSVNNADEVIGFLALEQTQYMFNFDSYVIDLGFYVLPTYRTTTVPYRLMLAGEAWAKLHGDAIDLGVSAPEDTVKTAKMYGKLGYRHWGTIMRKDF
ncbi:hypothetical protein UFOVP568_43 [uncultured Caudovirales phage]|uniref:N-acetyltransferase domain-containing protein n=1 Tax=uncultured Caudovirales phage TaxID=2100421 RepID=A0A6J5MUG8_9CAUD|nr:hypothetical protein UFOVP568_43 [uncultured Caudovirales phage]